MTTLVPQWDVIPPGLTWKEKVAYVAYALSLLPGTECPLAHKFGPGTYVREMFIPGGTLFVGREHRYGHLCQLISGSLVQVGPTAKTFATGPVQVQSQAGVHMVLYAVTDCQVRTVHANVTESRDIQLLESDAFLPASDLLELGEIVYKNCLLEKAS